MSRRLVYDRLARSPLTRAEAIVHHYTSMYSMALRLKGFIHQYHYSPDGLSTAELEAVEMLLSQITTAHEADLGIALNWKTPQPYGPTQQ